MSNFTVTLASAFPSQLPARMQASLDRLPSAWTSYIVPTVLGYLLLCQALRFRREKAMRRKYGYPDRASLARMTTTDAQMIISDLSMYEFPYMTMASAQFGLFKTYGVETISSLLLATRNLTDPIASIKRYEDTGVIIGEFLSNPPNSERAISAISRMNFLHAKYISSGCISNADLLYTLSVFITEPERFVRLYEWRHMNDMERCAYGNFWKNIGDAMGIQYEGFLSKAGEWRDGLDFAEDISRWAKAYEVVAFKPSAVSHEPAVTLVPMLTYWLPWFAQRFAHECVHVLLGDRAREAFMLPEPGIGATALVYTSLAIRRFFLRHLSLPRLIPVTRHASSPNPDGRLQTEYSYGNFPYYVKPTFWKRWGPEGWAIWIAGGKLPGDEPEHYLSQGFNFWDLGPKNRMGRGKEEMGTDCKRMKAKGMGGCPF
ncbi:uncharacterized protein BCR38DRAFT_425464 [Pseudomassariella vexata]|uniref:Uncharacterized protein n=1 Tax=Pseudomassariella vexata TaxID=1141098 RepID=A0A1Y2E614_9PEZI|nr:uncharacterized protein BCR38DRAFT_425464 [Pseudomassariella vexata]ORY66991.1 hypothetical protein BCR38DRAFT_425464 [Pseudomassariella vexata]